MKCNFYATCVDNGQGLTTCECPVSCDSLPTKEICGDDRQTYQNECEMRKTSCQQGRHITKGYDGSCGKLKFRRCSYMASYCSNTVTVWWISLNKAHTVQFLDRESGKC